MVITKGSIFDDVVPAIVAIISALNAFAKAILLWYVML